MSQSYSGNIDQLTIKFNTSSDLNSSFKVHYSDNIISANDFLIFTLIRR